MLDVTGHGREFEVEIDVLTREYSPNSGRPRSTAVRTINGATIFIRPTY